jgi:hypothetical protein
LLNKKTQKFLNKKKKKSILLSYKLEDLAKERTDSGEIKNQLKSKRVPKKVYWKPETTGKLKQGVSVAMDSKTIKGRSDLFIIDRENKWIKGVKD